MSSSVDLSEIDISTLKRSMKPDEGSFKKDGFTTIKKLAEGAYGQIDLIRRNSDLTYFAEKIYFDIPDYNEIDILSRFQHPNMLGLIARFIDSKNHIHLILPLADEDLYKRAQKGNYTIDQVLDWMFQILSAVEFLHSNNYYHCDIKTDNILLFNNQALLADFGYVYPLSFTSKVQCGTPFYASPQCLAENHVTVERSKDFENAINESCNQIQGDIYSLGAVFYELINHDRLNTTEFDIDNQQWIFNSYNSTESKILEKISSSETNPHLNSIYKCIYKMTRSSQKDRFKTVREILGCDVFSDRRYPIPGKVMYPTIPTIPTIPIRCSNNNLYQEQLKWCLETFYSDSVYSVNSWLLLAALLYRFLAIVDSSKEEQLHILTSACMYLANQITSSVGSKVKLDSLSRVLQIPQRDILKIINSIVVEAKGLIRSETIYDRTKNMAECFCWIMTACNDCDIFEKTLEEFHSEISHLIDGNIINENDIEMIEFRYNQLKVVTVKKEVFTFGWNEETKSVVFVAPKRTELDIKLMVLKAMNKLGKIESWDQLVREVEAQMNVEIGSLQTRKKEIQTIAKEIQQQIQKK